MRNQLHISRDALWITLSALLLIVFAVGCGLNPVSMVSSATPTALTQSAQTATQQTESAQQTSVPSPPASALTEPPTKVAFAVTPTSTPPAQSVQPTVPSAPKPSVATGRVAYTVVAGREPKLHTIWVANANGSNAQQIMTHAQWPTFSPDGSRIAYYGSAEGKSRGLYIANADGSESVLAVAGDGVCCMNWSRDGTWIVYANSGKPSEPGGPISMVKVDGAYKTIVNLGVEGNGPTFSPDGKQILYSGCPPNTSTCGLIVIPSAGGTPRLLTKDNGGNADWSPRGDKIVYQAADDAGHRQVYIVNADGSGKKQLTKGTSNDGQPVWSRDGNHIFWRSDQNGTAWAIFVMNADGSGPRKIIDNALPEPDLWGWESLSVAP